MGDKTEKKLIVLIVLFLITGVFVYGYYKPAEIKSKPPISRYFEHVDGYESLGFDSLAENHVSMLQLDDYVFANFKGHDATFNLYIGSYYSPDKAYKAHSPLACYPAQGWKVDSKPVTKTLKIGPYKIHHEEITTSLGQKKELVLFWYQSHFDTSTQVYRNKINMAYNRLVYDDDQYAFVRIAVPFDGASYDETKKQAVDFMKAFYPNFIEYIKQ